MKIMRNRGDLEIDVTQIRFQKIVQKHSRFLYGLKILFKVTLFTNIPNLNIRIATIQKLCGERRHKSRASRNVPEAFKLCFCEYSRKAIVTTKHGLRLFNRKISGIIKF